MKSETKFKNWFKKKWTDEGGWCESYEPARGGGVGIPDVQILVNRFSAYSKDFFDSMRFIHNNIRLPMLLPIEFKVGEVRDGKIFAKDIRPDQIGWHYRFDRAGGISLFLIGVIIDEGWTCHGILGDDRDLLMQHKQGFDIDDLLDDITFKEGETAIILP